MTVRIAEPGQFTGRHMLAIMLAFFGVIVCVNVGMAVLARTSWTGLVVANSYVASQEFNGKVAAARAQRALGRSGRVVILDGHAELHIVDRDGHAAIPRRASLTLRNPATDTGDRTIDLDVNGSPVEIGIADGLWIADIRAEMTDGSEWRDTRRFLVRHGSVQ